MKVDNWLGDACKHTLEPMGGRLREGALSVSSSPNPFTGVENLPPPPLPTRLPVGKGDIFFCLWY